MATTIVGEAKGKWAKELVDKCVSEIIKEAEGTRITATPVFKETPNKRIFACVRIEVMNSDLPRFSSSDERNIWIINMRNARPALPIKWLEHTGPASHSWLNVWIGTDIKYDSSREAPLYITGQVCFHDFDMPSQGAYKKTLEKEVIINSAFDIVKEIILWYKDKVASYNSITDKSEEDKKTYYSELVSGCDLPEIKRPV